MIEIYIAIDETHGIEHTFMTIEELSKFLEEHAKGDAVFRIKRDVAFYGIGL